VPIRAARQILIRAGSSRAGRCVALAALAMVLGSNGLQNAVAEGDTRTISLHHIHTNEDLTITYKRDGRYDEEALKKINHLLRDWRKDEEIRMDPRLIDVVWEAYRDLGAKGPIHVVCGYRSPATNAMLRRRSRGVAQFSQHMLGKAMDFFIPGANLEALREAGLKLQRGGVGFYPTSGSPFVHLDVGNVRMWPRMTHDQLVKVFPDGRTVHVPSDGHPLKNYALALADIQKRGSSEPWQTSLDAARTASVDANVADKPRRVASLRPSRDEDEDSEAAAAPAPAPKADKPAKPDKTADRRGAERNAKADTKTIKTTEARSTARGGGSFNLASADSVPVRPSMMAPLANDVIASRGFWDAPVAASADAPKRVELASAESRPALALRPRVEPQQTVGEATGTVAQWPVKDTGPAKGDRVGDRVAQDAALSYAAQTNAPPAAPVTRSLTPAAAALPSTAAKIADAAPARTAPGQSARKVTLSPDNPWMRALMLAPDLRNYFTTLALGDGPDPIDLVPLMAKPDTVVAMNFADDPQPDLSTDRFSGNAVVFVNTVAFAKRTASLR
jgi:uncharacterized protein YcbK (DUF882 family)